MNGEAKLELLNFRTKLMVCLAFASSFHLVSVLFTVERILEMEWHLIASLSSNLHFTNNHSMKGER